MSEPKPYNDDIWENFDVDDPNYREEYDIDLLNKIKTLYTELPDGWSKNNNDDEKKKKKKNVEDSCCEAPFIHVSGKTSWKHPNRAAVMKLVTEAHEKKKKMKEEEEQINNNNNNNNNKQSQKYGKSKAYYNPQDAMIKRLKKMVKHGVPLAAVEQRARLEGITDMSVLVDNGTNGTNALSSSSSPPPTRPCSPTIKHQKQQLKDPFKKYRLMLKNGVPLGAVILTAKRDNVVLPQDDAEFHPPPHDDDEKDNTVANNETTTKKKTHDVSIIFKSIPTKKQIEFMTFSDGTPEALLAKLVRRMVQTVQKRIIRRGGSLSNQNLIVDTQVLYNALGSFMGVQNQLRLFNKTFDDEDENNGEKDKQQQQQQQKEVNRLMRKPFLELARNLGVSTNTEDDSLLQKSIIIPGLDDLVDYIKEIYKEELNTIQSNLDCGMYDFDSLGQIYKPGTKVVAKNVVAGGIDMICQVDWNRYEEGKTLFGVSRYFKLCVKFCVAVGEHFTLVEVVHGIESSSEDSHHGGLYHLKSLQFVPLEAYTKEEVNAMRKDFQQRGNMYNKVAISSSSSNNNGGSNYLAYSKGSFFSKSTAGKKSSVAAAFATGGRIMVDTQGAYDYGHTLGVGYDPMIMSIKYKYKEYMLHMRSIKQKMNQQEQQQSYDNSDLMLFSHVPKEYLEMTWPAVVGFSFTNKAWGDVLVDGLQDIQFQEEAFDSLVLPASRKRMVKALVRHSSDSFNDVISGKGEGSVFLLYGPPGTGKTLTAEAISELLHRPLYSVSLGQLGMTPSDLESKLGEILDLCSRWDAVILLDEADIFLEKRSATALGSSLERNVMVSVMLRLVEYFKGVLFLTSNRIESLDPAFKTRITLALRYEELHKEARKQVWKNLLTASKLTNLDEKFDVDVLSGYSLNGREIKNAIRLAMALAAEDGCLLHQNYILETVDILNDFNEKMNSADAY